MRVAPPLSPSAYTYTLYPLPLNGNPDTVAVDAVVPPPVSKYPFIIRTFPGWSLPGNCQALCEVQVRLALVVFPDSSNNARDEELEAPLALFQLALGTAPAISLGAIATSPPTKSMLI